MSEDLKHRLKKSYDLIATKYNAWTIPNSHQRLNYLDKLLRLLSNRATSPISILELGCGCGIPVTQRLLDHDNFHVTANDLSTAQIDAARENLQSYAARLDLIQGDMYALNFASDSFDAVIGMYSLIHLPREEQAIILHKIAAWLKVGGYLLANFSGEATEGIVMENWLVEKGWVYWSGYGSKETVEKVRETGLQVVINQIEEDAVDASFLWLIAEKPTVNS